MRGYKKSISFAVYLTLAVIAIIVAGCSVSRCSKVKSYTVPSIDKHEAIQLAKNLIRRNEGGHESDVTIDAHYDLGGLRWMVYFQEADAIPTSQKVVSVSEFGVVSFED